MVTLPNTSIRLTMRRQGLSVDLTTSREPAGGSLASRLLRYVRAAPGAPAIHAYAAGATPLIHTRETLLAAASGVARSAMASGVRPGDRVLIALDDPAPFAIAFWGTQLCGAVAVPLTPISATQPSTLEAALRVQRVCGARLLLGHAPGLDTDRLPILPPEQWAATAEDAWRPGETGPDAIAIIQFTSGSTSDPKGCELTHRAVIANGDAIVSRTGTRALDSGVCWLPLHHDMGLMSGVVTPVLGGAATCLFPTARFLANPVGWLTALSMFPRTHTAVPNFALAVVLQRLQRRQPTDLDLSGVQTILCGAEPIDVPLVRDFLAACEPLGLAPQAFHAAYGMSETTVMATSCPGGLRADAVDIDGLRRLGVARRPRSGVASSEIACVGAPPDGGAVSIVSDAGAPVPDRQVGHVWLRSTSQMRRYYNDAEGTRSALADGWLKTGDLGYLADGELFVTGRSKEQIIVGGRNITPTDIEAAIARRLDLPLGRLAALGRRTALGTQEIVLVVETRDTGSAELRTSLSRACFEVCGLAPGAVELVERGSLPRTSSGKLRRLELQNRFEDALAAPVSDESSLARVISVTT
jgi:fatty-acyl-CoA synthase